MSDNVLDMTIDNVPEYCKDLYRLGFKLNNTVSLPEIFSCDTEWTWEDPFVTAYHVPMKTETVKDGLFKKRIIEIPEKVVIKAEVGMFSKEKELTIEELHNISSIVFDDSIKNMYRYFNDDDKPINWSNITLPFLSQD